MASQFIDIAEHLLALAKLALHLCIVLSVLRCILLPSAVSTAVQWHQMRAKLALHGAGLAAMAHASCDNA